MSLVKKEQFIWNFVEQGVLPACYAAIHLNQNTTSHIANSNIAVTPVNDQVIYVSLFPDFLNPLLNDIEDYSLKRIPHVNFSGVGIAIDETTTIDSYLKQAISSSTRGNLNKRKNRLESCFPIEYKMYYGAISLNEYTYLIDWLITKQKARIKSKRIKNAILDKYDNYKKIAFSLINSKEASLFVIYNNANPIAVSLNFHRQKLFFGTLAAYNMDYSKFGIGHILVYKQLEWCITHKYTFFDMGNGDLEYKKSWGNTFYNFQYHIIYRNKSILSFLISRIKIGVINFKNYIKKNKLDIAYTQIKNRIKKKKEIDYIPPSYFITELIENKLLAEMQLKPITTNSDVFKEIQKPICDFLYEQKDNINAIFIYEVLNEANIYLIQGTSKTMKISLNNKA